MLVCEQKKENQKLLGHPVLFPVRLAQTVHEEERQRQGHQPQQAREEAEQGRQVGG